MTAIALKHETEGYWNLIKLKVTGISLRMLATK